RGLSAKIDRELDEQAQIDTLNSTQLWARGVQEEWCLRELLAGKATEADLEKCRGILGMAAKEGAICAAILERSDDAIDDTGRQRLALHLSRLLPGRHALCRDAEGRLCLLACAESSESGIALRRNLEALAQALEEENGAPLLVAQGSTQATLAQACVSYQEAILMQKHSKLHSLVGVQEYGTTGWGDGEPGVFDVECRRRLQKLLRQKKTHEAHSLVDEVFAEITSKNLAPDRVYQEADAMLAASADVAPWQAPPVLKSGATISLQQLQNRVKNALAQAIGAQEGSGQGAAAFLADSIQNYIDENLADPSLCLRSIAGNHYISIQYLCLVFRRHKDQTVGDYLLQVRMERAKHHFDQGAKAISVVALKCGYEDANYFSKCFKRYYGVSPQGYIRNACKM
ncbi:MAG: helix-turn-helix transcriptional regulator, partial [Clostridiales bacterium]|nr:helix-turn-helix transcriptional regulator [Clostridiales bacterium]